jgi:hypothetical protein
MQLFDHLVGAGQQRGRHIEAERFCSLEIDDKVELSWLHDRQVGGFFTAENSGAEEAVRSRARKQAG